MGNRFGNVDWYCDKCGAYLNDQDGFDDASLCLEMH